MSIQDKPINPVKSITGTNPLTNNPLTSSAITPYSSTDFLVKTTQLVSKISIPSQPTPGNSSTNNWLSKFLPSSFNLSSITSSLSKFLPSSFNLSSITSSLSKFLPSSFNLSSITSSLSKFLPSLGKINPINSATSTQPKKDSTPPSSSATKTIQKASTSPPLSIPSTAPSTGSNGLTASPGMAKFKAQLNKEMDKAGITDPNKRKQIMAMAMIEGFKDIGERDASKDGTPSENGLLNINIEILKEAGMGNKKPKDLTAQEAVQALSRCIDKVGLDMTLGLQRAGETYRTNPNAYKMDQFLTAFNKTLGAINTDPKLMSNDTRLGMQVDYV